MLVTGASSGIGAEAARVLAHAGANVWFAGRDVAKTQRVRDAVVAEVGAAASGRLHVLALELSSLASVKKAAAEFLALGVPLHILLNNAGCMAVAARETTEDGFEMQVVVGARWRWRLRLPSCADVGEVIYTVTLDVRLWLSP